MCLQESTRKGTAILCDNIGATQVHISKFCVHNFIWKRKGMHAITLAVIFHHHLITSRVAWEIFPIRKVHFSFGKISQPALVYKL